MKNKIFGLILVFTISISTNSYSQSAEDLAMMEAMFNTAVDSGAGDQSGQACINQMNNKGWQEISTNRRGEKEYYVVGVGSVLAPIQSQNFASSVQNASTKALLDAKTKFSAILNQEITSEIVVDLKQQISEGKQPDILNDQSIDQNNPEYDDLPYLEKMKILVNQQLDKLIDPETKDSFNETAQSRNSDASELANKLEDILNQEQMTEIITTKTAADVRGMIVKYGNFAADQSRGKKPEVCIITKWSPGLLKMADAIATNDYKVLKSNKKKKPLKDQIPVNAFNERDFEGYMKLLGSFGTYLMRDENGDLNVVSFAVQGMASDSAQSQTVARQRAIQKANAQIIQFLNESVELNSKSTTTEALTEYKDGLQDYYTEQNFEQRQAASAQAKISGIQTLATYKGIQLLNQKPLIGAVTFYNPSSAEGAQDALKAFAIDPQKTSSKESGSNQKTLVPEDTPAVDTGAGYGDDDEDEPW